MALRLLRLLMRAASWILPDSLSRRLTRLCARALRTQLGGKFTDRFLELLLGALDLAFCLCRRLRRNLKGFEGRYVFETATPAGPISSSAVFHSGDMHVRREALKRWDVKITFDDPPALWAFLLQGGDILDVILEDKVKVEGNLNYIYKLGFMVSDLERILGVA